MAILQLTDAADIPLGGPDDDEVVVRMTAVAISDPVLRDCSP